MHKGDQSAREDAKWQFLNDERAKVDEVSLSHSRTLRPVDSRAKQSSVLQPRIRRAWACHRKSLSTSRWWRRWKTRAKNIQRITSKRGKKFHKNKNVSSSDTREMTPMPLSRSHSVQFVVKMNQIEWASVKKVFSAVVSAPWSAAIIIIFFFVECSPTPPTLSFKCAQRARCDRFLHEWKLYYTGWRSYFGFFDFSPSLRRSLFAHNIHNNAINAS